MQATYLSPNPKIRTMTIFNQFRELLQWSKRTYGQNPHVKGLTSLQVVLSDSPIVMFDELSTIPTALFYSLLLLPIFLGVILIFTPKIFFTKQ